MGTVIAQTLSAIEGLRSPVVRSCHVGNNTSNVWGWLALSTNTQLLQFDHTRFGLDENCLPWTRLGDRGRIDYCVDQNGMVQPEWIGKRVLEHLPAISRRHSGYLNYQIGSNANGVDLLRDHYQLASTLSRQMNGSVARCDTFQIAQHPQLLAAALNGFAQRRCLHLAIGRWIRRAGSGAGKIVSMPIKDIVYGPGGQLEVIESDGRVAFRGGVGELAARLIVAARQIADRFLDGTPVGDVDYPWLTLELAYFFQSVIEYNQAPEQVIFWHAGGSSSQYYINAAPIKERLRQVRDVLTGEGLLPPHAALTVIPTFCCQLFATTPTGLAILDSLIRDWKAYLDANGALMRRSLLSLQVAVHPMPVAARALRALGPTMAARIKHALIAFNAADGNRLPVAHCANLGHPSYNKFGTRQAAFLGQQLRFPASFYQLQWAEAELLVKVMAAIVADDAE